MEKYIKCIMGGTYFLNFGQIILMENLSTFHCYSNKVFEEARSVSGRGGRIRGNIQRSDYLGDISFFS